MAYYPGYGDVLVSTGMYFDMWPAEYEHYLVNRVLNGNNCQHTC